MTLGFIELSLYAIALFGLFMTPGPVWVALLARALSGGFHSAWPLALGVVIGDVFWALFAIWGVSWVLSEFSWFLTALQWGAVVMFLAMGVLLIKKSDSAISANSRLTRPGMMAGFIAGLIVIIGNPKAVLFYTLMLPGFFNINALTALDVVAICAVSGLIPFSCNLILAVFVGKIRALMASDRAIRRMNVTAGVLMILVAIVIAFSK